MTAVQLLIAVSKANGRLRADDGRLFLSLPPDDGSILRQKVKDAKPQILELLALNFLIVKSDTLRGHVFWVQDEATRKALIRHGAEPSTVWTRDELAQVCGKRPSPDDLRAMVTARWKAGAE